MGEVNENTEILTGIVEKGSTVYVVLGGENIPAVVTDGVFTLPLPAIKAGDRLVVHCEDANGNTSESVVKVALGTRGAIQVVVPAAVRLDQPIQISGSATANRELLVRMSVGGAERFTQLVQTDADGVWSVQVDPGRFHHDERVDVAAAYSDGLSPGADGEDYFLCDSMCVLRPDDQRLTEDMTIISGEADPDASLTLTYDGQNKQLTADEYGRFAFDALPLRAGMTVELSAVDHMGNTARASWQVEAGERAKITLALPTEREGYINSRDDTLILMGAAKKNLDVIVEIQGASTIVTPDDRGNFSVSLNPAAFEDGMLRIFAAYADGFTPACSAEMALTVDTQAPMLTASTIGDNEIEVTATELHVQSEPGAELILRAGLSESRKTADGQGNAVFSLGQQKVGTSYTLIASDAAGNETEQTITVIEQIRDVRIQINRPTRGEVVIGGRFGIDVFILQTAPIDLYYTITNNGEELVRGEVDADAMSDLRARDKEKMEAQYDDLEASYDGKRMRANIVIPQMVSDSMMLSIYSNDEGTEPVLLAQQPFACGAEEGIAGVDDDRAAAEMPQTVHERVTTDTFAFGLDKADTQVFAPSQVYLTGYNYSEGNLAMFFDYIIDGKRYTMKEIDEAGGSANATFKARNVGKELGELVPGLKKPNTRRGGAIMLLDLSFLPEGEHEIQVVLIVGSDQYLMQSRRIVTSSSVEVDKNVTRTLQSRWQ